ncbi:hypothetical protein FLT15_15400 [Paenibacillus thiaminolyticus]|uniref:nitrilase-related carbon-nitrogen hydrolase n=1 Tax=Paenibacillus thiaminolyticus TaxID=49283 RepID=UPI001163894D|nr:nitrilase-related carbon-nitrogen hydrolase [Paenibacillus thiaminolyticus]NGP59691.1 hypothetical protein [Paenibacillus thiaminolyticus]
MKNRYIKVAAIQSAPILFDKPSAMDKIAQMTREAAGQGAALIVFPEVFVPGYPRGLSFATKASYPADVACYEDIKGEHDMLCRGGSAIVGPLGEYVVEPLYNEEGILIATLDLSEVTRSRFDFDVTGHYSRPDVFQLIANDKKQEVVRTAGMS